MLSSHTPSKGEPSIVSEFVKNLSDLLKNRNSLKIRANCCHNYWKSDIIVTLSWLQQTCGKQLDLQLWRGIFMKNRISGSWRWDGSWVMDGSCSARWGGCKCWRSGFAKFLSFVATILLRCSQSDIGCEECYLSPSKKTYHHQPERKHISSGGCFHIGGLSCCCVVCCLLRFLIKNLALIFWLAISTHRTSNIFSSQKLFHFDMKSAKIF